MTHDYLPWRVYGLKKQVTLEKHVKEYSPTLFFGDLGEAGLILCPGSDCSVACESEQYGDGITSQTPIVILPEASSNKQSKFSRRKMYAVEGNRHRVHVDKEIGTSDLASAGGIKPGARSVWHTSNTPRACDGGLKTTTSPSGGNRPLSSVFQIDSL